MKTPTDAVLRFIQETTWEALPTEVRHQSKRCLLDGLGALIGGMSAPVSRLMTQIALEQFGGDAATILVDGSKTSLVGAALANGFAANALDIDDGFRLVKGHPGTCILPVILAAGERSDPTGAEFLSAFVVGYETAIRAGLILHATHRTYHCSGSWGALGGAAAGGRLLDLEPDRLRHAMGAAEYHAPFAPMMKGIAVPAMVKDAIGWGCMAAMSAVLMAEQGFTGVQPLFDDGPEPAWIDSLGREYLFLNLYFKPYSACRWAQPAVEGVLKLQRESGLSPADIAAIRVVTFDEAAALTRAHPANTEEAQYNMAFPIAAALLDGEVGPAQTLPPRLFDADIRALMDRIDVTAADRFNREFPAKALAEVVVETADGRSLKSGVMSAKWDAASGLPTDEELAAKFHRLATPILGKEKASKIAGTVWDFEKVGGLRELIEICVK
jgi:2-methylcitrate dehydratase PrpD